jgi:hypothetical protein
LYDAATETWLGTLAAGGSCVEATTSTLAGVIHALQPTRLTPDRPPEENNCCGTS